MRAHLVHLALLSLAVSLAWSTQAAEPEVAPLSMVRQPPCFHLIRSARQVGSGPVAAHQVPASGVPEAGFRILEVPAAACDFTGDGRGDATLFDGFTGRWYGVTLQGEPIFWAVPWGWSGSVPAPGDYDGDRVADLAVFEPESGLWAVRTVSGSIVLWERPWGWPGCVPVSGDYDGDGRSDLALFDPATGQWYIQSRSGAVLLWAFPWGWAAAPDRSAAIPVSGDFNGDGRADLIVRDARTGRWYAREVSGAVLAWDQEIR